MPKYAQKIATLLVTACICLLQINSHAQSVSFPEINITQANGEKFTTAQIPNDKQIALIYFSPECDHCQVFMKSFFKSANEFKNTQVLMITYLPLDRVVKFESEYPVSKYKNIVAGTEGMSFVVRDFYQIKEMPFAIMYDKQGKLIGKFEREIPIDKIINTLK